MIPARLPRQILEQALDEGQGGGGEAGGEVIMLGGEVSKQVPAGGIVVTTRPVTEAVKIVDGDRLVGSLDRSHLVETILPLAIHRSTLTAILAEVRQDSIDLPAEVAARGGRVVTR